MINLTLCVISESFPYNIPGDSIFLSPEINILSREFNKVIVFPKVNGDVQIDIPKNVLVSSDLANELKKISRIGVYSLVRFFEALCAKEFRSEVFKALHPYKLAKLLYYIAKAKAVARVINIWKDADRLNLKQTILYSYWFDGVVFGISTFRDEALAIVTRAHGADLYEFRHRFDYIPLREQSIRKLTAICFISRAGKDYYAKRFPQYVEKYFFHPLGFEDIRGDVRDSSGERFLLVSCSSVDSNKRIDLLVDGLAKLDPSSSKKISWMHFGTGPCLGEVRREAEKKLYNIQFSFLGYVAHEEVLQFYRRNKVDCFITVSASEGRPISIQEAQCFGIPIIATSVGGIPELLEGGGGVLLSENPSPKEIASAITNLLESDSIEDVRIASRTAWERNSRAEMNCRKFAAFLTQIAQREQGNAKSD